MAKELKLSSVKLRLGQKISPGGNRGRQESKGVNQIKICKRKLSPRYSQEHLQLNGEKIRPNWCSQSQVERRQHISKVSQENTEVWNYEDKAHLLNLLMNDAWKFKGTSSVGHLPCRNQPASLSNQHMANVLQPIDWEHWNSLLFHNIQRTGHQVHSGVPATASWFLLQCLESIQGRRNEEGGKSLTRWMYAVGRQGNNQVQPTGHSGLSKERTILSAKG